MKAIPKNTGPQGRRSVMRNVIAYAGTMVLVGPCIFWWLAQEKNIQVSGLPVVATAPLAEPGLLPADQDKLVPPEAPVSALTSSADVKGSQSLNLEEGQPQATPAQSQLFETLWARLHDPDLRDDLTIQQIMDTPGFKAIPVELMQCLVDEVMAMLARGELNGDRFMAQQSGRREEAYRLTQAGQYADEQSGELSETAQNSAVVVTPEQRASFEEIQYRLGDPAFTQSLTATKLLSMQEVQSLPESLRQELAIEVMQMLEHGELDRNSFLAAPTEPGAPAEGGRKVSSGRMATGTEGQRTATTHEQWRAYEDLRARLHNPGLRAELDLAQLLSGPEWQNLPAHMRTELQADAAEITKQGAWARK